MDALHDLPTLLASINCQLLNFFKTRSMRIHACLLQYMIRKWDLDIQAFRVGLHILEINLKDIYFLTGLSKWGIAVSMSSHWNTKETTNHYISQYCVVRTQRKSEKILINDVANQPLKTIIFNSSRVFGSMGAHHATKSQIIYALEYT